MKIVIFPLMLLLSLTTADADCRKDYRRYKRATLLKPVSSPISSTGQVTGGMGSSTGGVVAGTVISSPDLSTAGFVYGAAYAWDGQYNLQNGFSDITRYRSRARVLKLIKQSGNGMGEELEEFVDDLNETLINPVSLLKISGLINEGNAQRIFCPAEKALFTLKNLTNWLLDHSDN